MIDCSLCGKSFQKQASLRQHQKAKHKNLECKLCKKIFASKKQYKKHNWFSHYGKMHRTEKSRKRIPQFILPI